MSNSEISQSFVKFFDALGEFLIFKSLLTIDIPFVGRYCEERRLLERKFQHCVGWDFAGTSSFSDNEV